MFYEKRTDYRRYKSSKDIKAALKGAFKELKDDVLIEVYTKIGVNDMFNELAVNLIEAMAEANSKIKIKLYKLCHSLVKSGVGE